MPVAIDRYGAEDDFRDFRDDIGPGGIDNDNQQTLSPTSRQRGCRRRWHADRDMRRLHIVHRRLTSDLVQGKNTEGL